MERQTFEITVGEHELELKYGRVVVKQFVKMSEVDYFMVNIAEEGEEPESMRVYNNQDFAHWLAGYKLEVQPDGSIERPSVFMDGQTFREITGWNAPSLDLEEPWDWEIDEWVEVNSRDLESGLDEN